MRARTGVLAMVAAAACVLAADWEPAQPIAFSHRIHAGQYKMDCLYCHSGARRSTVAGIPSLQFCMGCHKVVAVAKPEIALLRGYWERKVPVPWARVVKEPDFVFFNHSLHVQRGFRCQECHGPIETMTQVRLAQNLNMDRCVSCHRTHKMSIDCYVCHR